MLEDLARELFLALTGSRRSNRSVRRAASRRASRTLAVAGEQLRGLRGALTSGKEAASSLIVPRAASLGGPSIDPQYARSAPAKGNVRGPAVAPADRNPPATNPSTPASPAHFAPPGAEAIARDFRDPARLRAAIVMAEILAPPVALRDR